MTFITTFVEPFVYNYRWTPEVACDLPPLREPAPVKPRVYNVFGGTHHSDVGEHRRICTVRWTRSNRTARSQCIVSQQRAKVEAYSQKW